jgi:tryptophan aminotransferase
MPFLSDVAKARLDSIEPGTRRKKCSSLKRLTHTVRSLLPLEATPGILSLLAGKPNPTDVPIYIV